MMLHFWVEDLMSVPEDVRDKDWWEELIRALRENLDLMKSLSKQYPLIEKEIEEGEELKDGFDLVRTCWSLFLELNECIEKARNENKLQELKASMKNEL